MARQPIPEKGVPSEVLTLLELVRNPEDYATKITALQAAIDQHNATIEKVIGLDDIEAARLNANLDRQAAAAKFAEAEKAADAMLDNARKMITAAEAKIATATATLEARAANLTMSEATLKQDRNLFEEATQRLIATLKEREQTLASQRLEYETMVAEFDAKRARLQAAIA